MMARLGFALAVNTDPDVVLVDEVLAVGDAEFQLQSARRLLQFTEEGKAMILVSHMVDQVEHICSRAMWLDGGRVVATGPGREVARDYRSFLNGRIERVRAHADGAAMPLGAGQPGIVEFSGITLDDGTSARPGKFHTGGVLRLQARIAAREPLTDVEILVSILNEIGAVVDEFTLSEKGIAGGDFTTGGRLTVRFDPLGLFRGRYTIAMRAFRHADPDTILGSAVPQEVEVEMPYSAQPLIYGEMPSSFKMD
jgi:ABC-2 type transport system ATP-binding protein